MGARGLMRSLWKDGFVEVGMMTYHDDLLAKPVPKKSCKFNKLTYLLRSNCVVFSEG